MQHRVVYSENYQSNLFKDSILLGNCYITQDKLNTSGTINVY